MKRWNVWLAAAVVAFAMSAGCSSCTDSGTKKEPNNAANNGNNNVDPNSGTNGATNGATTGGSNNNGSNDPWADEDGDGFIDRFDNCPGVDNPEQEDGDGDGVGDACDNCLEASNFDQEDADDNGVGDACEGMNFYNPDRDDDGDGVPDNMDNCGGVENPDQTDTDMDSIGDACDNCPNAANYDQADSDMDGEGDACSAEPVGMLCGEQESDFVILKPNIFILLDESGSMGFSCGSCTNTYPYQDALDALDQIADNTAMDARFGVGTYESSSSASCGSTTEILLPMGEYTAAQMKMSWPECAGANQPDCYAPDGGTPTADGLELVRTEGHLSEPGDPQDAIRTKAVILITDGDPNDCGGQDGSVMQAQALADQGVPVYVVAFNFGGNEGDLNDVAAAGGTDAPPMGGDRFYSAGNTNELVMALQNIATEAISCSYEIDPPAPDPNKIWVELDGTPIPRANYSYDEATATLTLDQATCDQLRMLDPMGMNPPLKIIIGCATECEPEPETCDYQDNDCDGEIDEGCEGCEPEICDGIDNDCDDAVDEGCPDCLFDGEMCSEDGDCCNGNCNEQGICGPPCRPLNTSCRSNDDCCSGVCAKNGGDVGTCVGG
jgi:hypothetical protein